MNAVTVEKLQDWLARGEPVMVLDIRPEAEAREWAIPGSVNAPVYDALKAGDTHAMDGVAAPSDRPVVTVCKAGRVAAAAEKALRERGIEAYTLEGGMESWSLAWSEAKPIRLPGETIVIQVLRVGKGCLSYIAGSTGQATVIDPSVDPTVYEEIARRQGWTISAVLDTHIHADHLSRARSLAVLTGAELYLPKQDRARFSFKPLEEGSAVEAGGARLQAMHMPGHTWESTCFLLNESALFTGDTLFTDSIGRPDLKADPEEFSRRAGALYRSLMRLRELPGDTLVLPGHTSEPLVTSRAPVMTSLGEALSHAGRLDSGEAEFIESLLGRIPPTPPNYEQIVKLNEDGAMPADPAELEAGANRCAIG